MVKLVSFFFLILLISSSCGKKGKLFIEGQEKEDSSIIFEERNYKF